MTASFVPPLLSVVSLVASKMYLHHSTVVESGTFAGKPGNCHPATAGLPFLYCHHHDVFCPFCFLSVLFLLWNVLSTEWESWLLIPTTVLRAGPGTLDF